MKPIDSTAAPADAASASQDEQLRRAARELEGVFVTELFKAMRQTVPEGGLTGGGMGEEMFTGMLDQHLAPRSAAGWERGIADALYRQLRPASAGQGGGEEAG